MASRLMKEEYWHMILETLIMIVTNNLYNY
ncbi:hypothetical protein Golax_010337 [Gossypium laxum]|uniref:Uncharacterized protein n=2 Tax=Gossypium TaxID=3633 RepID=A0A7J8ZGZ3_9ROSI|nr:hypothetical protein [Gossypium laxum]